MLGDFGCCATSCPSRRRSLRRYATAAPDLAATGLNLGTISTMPLKDDRGAA